MTEASDSTNYANEVYGRVRNVIDSYGEDGEYGDPIRRAGFVLPKNPARLVIDEVPDPSDWDGDLAYRVRRNHDPRGRYDLFLSTQTALCIYALAHIDYDIKYYANLKNAQEYKNRAEQFASEKPRDLERQRIADLSLAQDIVPHESTMTRQERREWIEWLSAKRNNTSKAFARYMLQNSIVDAEYLAAHAAQNESV